MDTTIGTLQDSTTANGVPSFGSVGNYWGARFISNPLDSGSTSISANTWTLNYAGENNSNNIADVAPNITGGSNAPVHVTCYVWRPSTGAKVGNILDGSSANVAKFTTTLHTERSVATTFSGVAVTGAIGDVIIVELWFHIKNSSNTSGWGASFYFDGTTETTTHGTAVTDHASFLETPQTLTFSTPAPSSIDATVTSSTITNKIITII